MTDLDELKHRIRTQYRAKLHHAVIAASMQQHDVVVFQGGSRPATVISNIVFDFDIVFSAITTTFLTVVDQSNTCTQIARPVWFNSFSADVDRSRHKGLSAVVDKSRHLGGGCCNVQ